MSRSVLPPERSGASQGPEAGRSLGRATAIVVLAPFANRLAEEREREKRAEREEQEAERRAERKALRAQARSRLIDSARRELFLLGAWTIGWAVVAGGVSMALTFLPPGADFIPALRAAAQYQWESALIAGAVMLIGGWAYDALRAASGEMAWSAHGTSQLDWFLLTLGATGVFVYSAAGDGSVPPTAWSAVLFVAMAAFLVTLALRLLLARIRGANARKLTALGICTVTLGAAWILAPRSDIPSPATQRQIDRRLIVAVPMDHCSRRSIEALPSGLFRNSLEGLVHCHQGHLQGTFIAFRNRQLLDIYVSQVEHAVENRPGDPADRCSQRSGTYIAPWYKESHPNVELGQSFCYGSGNRAKLAWSDTRSNLFAAITGRPRSHLYGWWHSHSVSLRRPG